MTNAEHPAYLRAAARALKQWFGIEVPPYRMSVLAGELDRLGGRVGPESAVERLLVREQAAWDAVLDAMTIPETYLFRHFGHFELLRDLATRRKLAGEPCRVLCAGCASGEEVWSAAAVLADVSPHVSSVVGWDVSEQRLAIARAGRYRDWSVRAGLHGYDRYFQRSGDGCEVSSALRPLVSFRRVNLVAQLPAEARFDAVLFRNVGIYWVESVATAAVGALAELIANDGLFLVGPTDPARISPARWEHLIERGVRYYRRAAEVHGPGAPDPPPRPVRRVRQPPRAVSAATTARPVETPLPPASPARHVDRRPQGSRTPSSSSADHARLVEARALADAGRSREALALLDSLCDPSVNARLFRGILLLDLEQPHEAITALRQCVFLEPRELAPRRWLAIAYEAAGRTADAARENRNVEELGGA